MEALCTEQNLNKTFKSRVFFFFESQIVTFENKSFFFTFVFYGACEEMKDQSWNWEKFGQTKLSFSRKSCVFSKTFDVAKTNFVLFTQSYKLESKIKVSELWVLIYVHFHGLFSTSVCE